MVYAEPEIRPGEWDTKFSGILRYKLIIKSQPEDQT